MSANIVNMAQFRASRDAESATAAGLLMEKEPREGGNVMATLLTREEPRWADHRCEPRHVVEGSLTAAVVLGGTTARMANISSNGLMVNAEMHANVGSRVPVNVAGCQTLFGRVIWKRNGQIGLEVPMGSMALL